MLSFYYYCYEINSKYTYISATASPTPQNFASSSMPSSLMTVLSTSKHTASALRKISFISKRDAILLGPFLLWGDKIKSFSEWQYCTLSWAIGAADLVLASRDEHSLVASFYQRLWAVVEVWLGCWFALCCCCLLMFNLRYRWAVELWSVADLLFAGSAHWCSHGVQGCNTWHSLNHQTANCSVGLAILCLILPSPLKWILISHQTQSSVSN